MRRFLLLVIAILLLMPTSASAQTDTDDADYALGQIDGWLTAEIAAGDTLAMGFETPRFTDAAWYIDQASAVGTIIAIDALVQTNSPSNDDVDSVVTVVTSLSDAHVRSAALCDESLVSNDQDDAETCRNGITQTTDELRQGREALRNWDGGDFDPGAEQDDPDRDTPTTETSATATPTREPTATPTREPTATPTREPTATPDSDEETTAEREFMTSFYLQTADSGDQLQSLSDLTDEIVADPTLLLDTDTQRDLTDILDDIRATHDDALALEPSDRQEDIYDLWTEITGYLSDAADEYELGFLTFDADAIERGTALVNQTDEPLDDLAVAVDDYLEDTGQA